MTVKLWHCDGARSLRPLWTLEEMGLNYELVKMQFPPRFLHPGYTELNPIGTVPFFTDDREDRLTEMTESSGICQYLVDTYGADDLTVRAKKTIKNLDILIVESKQKSRTVSYTHLTLPTKA